MTTEKRYCVIGMCENEIEPWELVCDEHLEREPRETAREFEIEFAQSEWKSKRLAERGSRRRG